ncbi:unnamed protein product [Penicillium salamii]|nr:unnamed protein product [Penicillium salamii]
MSDGLSFWYAFDPTICFQRPCLLKTSQKGAISDVRETINESNDEEVEIEGKEIITGLETLESEIQSDAKLSSLPDDGSATIAGYNKELTQRDSTWLNVFWLFGECYLYKRIHWIFSQCPRFKDYDVFARQKRSTFKSSKSAILELAARYRTIITESAAKDTASELVLFKEMCEVCLWGNATDLSLLTSLTYEDIQKLQGSQARETQSKNVLINDLPAAFDALKQAQIENPSGGRVDIVLDNAGFELYVDLLLAGYLLSTGLASNVVFHPKSIPWFVSDVVPADFTDLLSALEESEKFFNGPQAGVASENQAALTKEETDNLLFLCEQWNGFLQSGKMSIREDPFWTTAGSYWRLPYVAPELFNELKDSELVLFKGDLNYRKLTGDVNWETGTCFPKAIGPLGEGSGVRTLALRTCKADVVVGLPEGEDERLRSLYGGEAATEARKWAWSGKWAVISFCDGKPH